MFRRLAPPTIRQSVASTGLNANTVKNLVFPRDVLRGSLIAVAVGRWTPGTGTPTLADTLLTQLNQVVASVYTNASFGSVMWFLGRARASGANTVAVTTAASGSPWMDCVALEIADFDIFSPIGAYGLSVIAEGATANPRRSGPLWVPDPGSLILSFVYPDANATTAYAVNGWQSAGQGNNAMAQVSWKQLWNSGTVQGEANVPSGFSMMSVIGIAPAARDEPPLFVAGGGAFDIDAEAGVFALTGTAAGLRATRRLTAESGSFALTGTAAALRRSYPLVAAPGSYAVAGSDAGLRATRLIGAAPGAFAVTGTAASLRHDRKLTVDPGAFVVTGTDATLIIEGATVLSADPGAFVVTGTAAGLRVARRLSAETGAFAMSGQAAALRGARRLIANSAAFAIAGQTAALRRATLLAATPGAVALTGSDATLRCGRALLAVPGAIALTGTAAALRRAARLLASAGVYAWVGSDAVLIYSGALIPVAGATPSIALALAHLADVEVTDLALAHLVDVALSIEAT